VLCVERRDYPYKSNFNFSDNIGIMSNAQISNGNGLFDAYDFVEDQSAKRRLIEGRIDYFEPINNWGVFEIYCGAGIGKVSFDERGRIKHLTNIQLIHHASLFSQILVIHIM